VNVKTFVEVTVRHSYIIFLQSFSVQYLGTVDNDGNTEITETVIFVNAVSILTTVVHDLRIKAILTTDA